MAEDAKSDELNPVFYWIFGILIFLILASAFFSGEGLLSVANPENPNSIENLENRNKPVFSLDNLIGTGDLVLGEKALALKEVQIRNLPGGRILGLQDKLSEGRLMEGPIAKFGTTWWRVNFEEAPSGWTEFDSLTSKALLTKTIYFPTTLYKGYKPIGWVLSIVLIIILIILSGKLSRENKIAEKKLRVEDEETEREKGEQIKDARGELGLENGEQFKNQRWEHVMELMKTNNQNDWRQAIIEADIILDEMLRRMGYKGLTIGDMLKEVDPADFATLQKAWDAHKFRNEIAHTGSEFKISRDEAERVINLYKSVFGEFYYI